MSCTHQDSVRVPRCRFSCSHSTVRSPVLSLFPHRSAFRRSCSKCRSTRLPTAVPDQRMTTSTSGSQPSVRTLNSTQHDTAQSGGRGEAICGEWLRSALLLRSLLSSPSVSSSVLQWVQRAVRTRAVCSSSTSASRRIIRSNRRESHSEPESTSQHTPCIHARCFSLVCLLLTWLLLTPFLSLLSSCCLLVCVCLFQLQHQQCGRDLPGHSEGQLESGSHHGQSAALYLLAAH